MKFPAIYRYQPSQHPKAANSRLDIDFFHHNRSYVAIDVRVRALALE